MIDWQNLNPRQKASCGAVMGALTGDAAGAVLEFLGHRPSAQEVKRAMTMPGGGVFGVAPGQFTDDGEMTVTLLSALASNQGVYDLQMVANAYGRWADSGPFDIGGATSAALRHLAPTGGALEAMQRAEENNMASKANGSLMRATPLGLAGTLVSAEETIFIAKQDSRLTHPNEACQAAVAAYALAIRHLILQPGDASGAIKAAEDFLAYDSDEVADWMTAAVSGDLPPAWPQIGFVKIGFIHAFHHLASESTYSQALRETLERGGDTDTNACIVGGLVGAAVGVTKIPRSMLDWVIDCDTSSGQTRPTEFTVKSAESGLVSFMEKIGK